MSHPIARALTPDELAEVAHLRAHGQAWEIAAQAVGREPAELRRAVRASPEYDRLYELAAREVRHEAEAEMLLIYRAQMRNPDTDLARKAADAIAKHLAGERRDRTRLAVEEMRASAARAKAEEKRLKAAPPAERGAAPVAPASDIHQPEIEAHHARRAVDSRAVVWLWGGAHKIGGTAPDPATDTPLFLFGDDTVPGRKVYWAARVPLRTDPFDGPFPAPAEPVPELSPEQAAQLAPGRTGADPASGPPSPGTA